MPPKTLDLKTLGLYLPIHLTNNNNALIIRLCIWLWLDPDCIGLNRVTVSFSNSKNFNLDNKNLVILKRRNQYFFLNFIIHCVVNICIFVDFFHQWLYLTLL